MVGSTKDLGIGKEREFVGKSAPTNTLKKVAKLGNERGMFG